MEFQEPEVLENVNYIDGFKIDEDASRFSNGITTSSNEKGLDIKVDLHVRELKIFFFRLK